MYIVHGLYFLWHVTKVVLPSYNHYAAFVPRGPILNLIKRIQLTQLWREKNVLPARSHISHRLQCHLKGKPMEVGNETWGRTKNSSRIRGKENPHAHGGPSDNNSSIDYVFTQPRVINNTERLSKEWWGWLTHKCMLLLPWESGKESEMESWHMAFFHQQKSTYAMAATMMFSVFPVFLQWHLARIFADYSDRMPLEVFSSSEWVFW